MFTICPVGDTTRNLNELVGLHSLVDSQNLTACILGRQFVQHVLVGLLLLLGEGHVTGDERLLRQVHTVVQREPDSWLHHLIHSFVGVLPRRPFERSNLAHHAVAERTEVLGHGRVVRSYQLALRPRVGRCVRCWRPCHTPHTARRLFVADSVENLPAVGA